MPAVTQRTRCANPILSAFLAGVMLALILEPVVGRLAAIPFPPTWAAASLPNVSFRLFVGDSLLHVLPIALLACLFGLGLFAWLKSRRPGVVIACLAGYLAIVILLTAVIVVGYADDPLAVVGSIASDPLYWYRLSAVPLGLVLASRLRRFAA